MCVVTGIQSVGEVRPARAWEAGHINTNTHTHTHTPWSHLRLILDSEPGAVEVKKNKKPPRGPPPPPLTSGLRNTSTARTVKQLDFRPWHMSYSGSVRAPELPHTPDTAVNVWLPSFTPQHTHTHTPDSTCVLPELQENKQRTPESTPPPTIDPLRTVRCPCLPLSDTHCTMCVIVCYHVCVEWHILTAKSR